MQNKYLIPLALGAGLVIFVGVLLYMPALLPDVDWDAVNGVVVQLMPWVIVFGVGIFGLYYSNSIGAEYSALACVLIGGLLGIVSVMMLQVLYDNSVIIDTMVTADVTLQSIQIIALVLWVLLGTIVGAVSR